LKIQSQGFKNLPKFGISKHYLSSTWCKDVAQFGQQQRKKYFKTSAIAHMLTINISGSFYFGTSPIAVKLDEPRGKLANPKLICRRKWNGAKSILSRHFAIGSQTTMPERVDTRSADWRGNVGVCATVSTRGISAQCR